MKQNISKNQVLSLNDKQYVGLLNALYGTDHKIENLSRGSAGCDFGNEDGYFTSALETRTNIGKMIEILGNKLCSIHPLYEEDGESDKLCWWEVIVNGKTMRMIELCDALFEAIKEVFNV